MNHRRSGGRWVLAPVSAALLLVLGACGGGASAPPSPSSTPAPVPVKGSVVATAMTANETTVTVPVDLTNAWNALAQKGQGAELVSVAGDGTSTSASNVNFSGDGIQRLTQQINSDASKGTDRSALAGLNAIASPAGSPVWVFSPLLDSVAPLNFNQLAFDEAPASAIKRVKQAGDLPKLKGRQVTFVVTPVAGQQKKLSDLQVGYQRAVWEGLAKAAGAKGVAFFVGTGSTPGSGTGPVIVVPDPNDKINAQKQGKVSTCTLPAPALFIADQPALIDKKATLKALKDCLGTITPSTKITVEGHTAGSSGTSNSFAKQLSTQRATEVAALLKELGVAPKNVTKVVGYGADKPLVQPGTNPKNRAVVVTFTTSS